MSSGVWRKKKRPVLWSAGISRCQKRGMVLRKLPSVEGRVRVVGGPNMSKEPPGTALRKKKSPQINKLPFLFFWIYFQSLWRNEICRVGCINVYYGVDGIVDVAHQDDKSALVIHGDIEWFEVDSIFYGN